MDLQTPVSQVSRSYKMFSGRLEKLGITKVEDFLFHIPFRYDDYSIVSDIQTVQEGETVTIKGVVKKIENIYTRRFKTLQKAVITDSTGEIDILWFNQPFLTKVINQNDKISLSGKVEKDKGKPIIRNPDYEVIFEEKTIHTGRLVPIYPETRGITSKWMRRQIYNILEANSNIEDYLPLDLVKKENLMLLSDALWKVHFPSSLEEAEEAKKRLAFNELFEIQLSALVRKKEWKKEVITKKWKIDDKKIKKLISLIPFKLTNAQTKAVDDILNDFSKESPMNRLLEGDVGSGKTIVATIAMYVAFLNGFQSAFMAPTEILAKQHFKTINDLLSPLGIKIELLTSSVKKIDNNFDVLVGTHSLVHKKAEFKNLGLVIIDEQQRFGVEQRSIIRKKGKNPHLLTMTATPIPRTVALTMYGDLDLSILDEMPHGRKQIKTWLVPLSKREGAYNWIEERVQASEQVFIVCPFIEESESMQTVKAATKEYEKLKKDIFPKLKLGLMHGKLKAKEKDQILKDFRDKKIDILVSTPVVEVGIDIPNATVMLIEEAERFGLAQLHQLRGRVGRSDMQSYCLLFTQSKNPLTITRLKSLETVFSGALLSELDLKLRGPGQVFGVVQHGVPKLKVATFSDFDLIEKTKTDANEYFSKISEYPKLLEKVNIINSKNVSPD